MKFADLFCRCRPGCLNAAVTALGKGVKHAISQERPCKTIRHNLDDTRVR
jgi:hypothetical protein